MESFIGFLIVVGIVFGLPLLIVFVPVIIYNIGYKHGEQYGKDVVEEDAVAKGFGKWQYNTTIHANGKRTPFRWMEWNK